MGSITKYTVSYRGPGVLDCCCDYRKLTFMFPGRKEDK